MLCQSWNLADPTNAEQQLWKRLPFGLWFCTALQATKGSSCSKRVSLYCQSELEQILNPLWQTLQLSSSWQCLWQHSLVAAYSGSKGPINGCQAELEPILNPFWHRLAETATLLQSAAPSRQQHCCSEHTAIIHCLNCFKILQFFSPTVLFRFVFKLDFLEPDWNGPISLVIIRQDLPGVLWKSIWAKVIWISVAMAW
jgi:hypothetical protein